MEPLPIKTSDSNRAVIDELERRIQTRLRGDFAVRDEQIAALTAENAALRAQMDASVRPAITLDRSDLSADGRSLAPITAAEIADAVETAKTIAEADFYRRILVTVERTSVTDVADEHDAFTKLAARWLTITDTVTRERDAAVQRAEAAEAKLAAHGHYAAENMRVTIIPDTHRILSVSVLEAALKKAYESGVMRDMNFEIDPVKVAQKHRDNAISDQAMIDARALVELPPP